MNRDNLLKVLELEEKIKGYEKILNSSCITSLILGEGLLEEDAFRDETHEFDVHISVPIVEDDLIADIDNLHIYYHDEFKKIIERRVNKLTKELESL
jgi:glutamyl-tRNA reductase